MDFIYIFLNLTNLNYNENGLHNDNLFQVNDFIIVH